MKLANIFQDGAILQRDQPLKIWGWAQPGTEITVELQSAAATVADAQGNWSVTLPALPAGGPYQLRANDRVLENIYLGDLWLCAGQSNMELPMTRVKRAFPGEVETTINPLIRQYLLPVDYDFDGPRQDTAGTEWISVEPAQTDRFSATGYFFAKKVHEAAGVPIGLIMTAVGGTPIEAWMSEKSLQWSPERLNQLAEVRVKDHVKKIQAADLKTQDDWHAALNRYDMGLFDKWFDLDYDDSGWNTIRLTEGWRHYSELQQPGAVWLRLAVDLEEGGPGQIDLGTLLDGDTVYVNGLQVGTTGYQYPPRIYPVHEFKKGRNVIAVRVAAIHQTGGFTPGKDRHLLVGGHKISLDLPWRFRRGVTMPRLAGQTFFQNWPTGCYNAMIAPLQQLPLKGILWYQGESNAGRPEEYGRLLRALVHDWRQAWGELPFLAVQLANWVLPNPEVSWAWLREQQSQILNLPRTGLAIALDAGEANDLHPLDKQTVGTRLALQALKIAYGKSVKADGPKLVSFKRQEQGLALEFDEPLMTAGLVTDFEAEVGEAIIPLKAHVSGHKVYLEGPGLEGAAFVRYGWCDSPGGALLYGAEGLPAAPFRFALSPMEAD